MQPPYYGPGAPNYGGQEQYAQQQAQPGGYQQDPRHQGGYADNKMALAPNDYQGERFKPARPKIRDPFFALLFIIVFLGYTGLSVYVLREYAISGVSGGLGGNTGASGTLNSHTALLLTFSCALALVLSGLYLLLVRVATRFILEITLLLSVISSVAYAAYLWYEGFTSAAIMATIFAVLAVVSYFFMRSRIPLTRLLLKTTIDATRVYPSVYLWALTGLVAQTLFSIWVSWTLIAVYQRFSPSGAAAGSSSSSGAVTGLVVFIGFAFYWISETIKAIFFSTVCAIFGTHYYSLDNQKQRGAGIKAFGRATSFSLGSLAFGSLIVAILDIIRGLVSIIQQTEASQGDMVGAAIACVAGCIISCIAWLIEFFNKYALINVSLYGNSYITAAKETWRLMKDRGIDALATDSLVNIVWTYGSIVVGILVGIFAYVYEKQTDPEALNQTSSYYSIILLAAVALATQICLTLGQGSIGSGTATLFVALAEDPQTMAQKEPQLFELIRRSYPRVVQGVA
ncbi:DUF580-domain-containing protein [Microstroma glucosiphilum]|uniref:Protein PNS1 n=1 Tax=Pseudomicrostroma glucosiphilum TaxID=1684307 RepID=A0A316U4P5_9BASI|nr:DUF580-domain-containing protein [Pseudomicrostroma glucosiphilum]PWN19798.1 DUF580-domain-containing protein [Pseudomicrostroma glucosiphilum]